MNDPRGASAMQPCSVQLPSLPPLLHQFIFTFTRLPSLVYTYQGDCARYQLAICRVLENRQAPPGLLSLPVPRGFPLWIHEIGGRGALGYQALATRLGAGWDPAPSSGPGAQLQGWCARSVKTS